MRGKIFIFVFLIMLKAGAAPQQTEVVDTLEEVIDLCDLVVFNDDVNTFAHVIKTLVRVCRHTYEQAEQCAWIIHYKGKCTVKSGSFSELKPMREAITEAGIDARIL
jgi:ATP-dependent Clp protease adaptor protein ClpS